jgi:hypothetical protein
MKLYLPLFIGLCIGIAVPANVQPASAQMQGGAPTVGARPPVAPPQETRAEKRKKSAVCTQAARNKKLKLKDRTAFLKACNAKPYSDPFTPPDWPPL